MDRNTLTRADIELLIEGLGDLRKRSETQTESRIKRENNLIRLREIEKLVDKLKRIGRNS